jgi:hypothetical protein
MGETEDGEDRIEVASQNCIEPVMFNGPTKVHIDPMPLATPSDEKYLTALQCFTRVHCVEFFSATETDVLSHLLLKRNVHAIEPGQIGIRCPHCTSSKHSLTCSVIYPTSVSTIYEATMHFLTLNFYNCPCVSDVIKRNYSDLKACRAQQNGSRRYWIKSAQSLGLVNTAKGIRVSAAVPPVMDLGSALGDVLTDGIVSDPDSNTYPVVTDDDALYTTSFSYLLLLQMRPSAFSIRDSLPKRTSQKNGFPGLACLHCFCDCGTGRYFPSKLSTMSNQSKTLFRMYDHLMYCHRCPRSVKEDLYSLFATHEEEKKAKNLGRQNVFFGRIWDRLHKKQQSN